MDITSRYDGTIVKLHYEVGDMAIVGQALLEIDVRDDVDGEAPFSGQTGSR